jgi:hypothetical protein
VTSIDTNEGDLSKQPDTMVAEAVNRTMLAHRRRNGFTFMVKTGIEVQKK